MPTTINTARPVGPTAASAGDRPALEQAARKATYTPQLQQMADTTLLAGIQNSQFAGQAEGLPPGSPELPPPSHVLPRATERVRQGFEKLMLKLIALLGEVSEGSASARLEILKKMSQSATEAARQHAERYAEAVKALEAALDGAQQTEAKLEAARERLAQAQNDVAAARAQLEGLEPGTPEYKAAQAALERQQQQLLAIQKGAEQAKLEHRAATDVAGKAAVAADEIAKQALEAAGSGRWSSELEGTAKKEISAGARLVALMLRFSELMGETQDKKLESDVALFKELQAARQAEMNRKAEEYAKEMEKAAKAAKAANCIGKVVMAVTAVAGVVATLATGGLAAGAFVAVLAAATPLLDKALKPVTDGLMQALGPVLEGLMKAVSGLLQDMGVDASTAMLVASVAVSVALAAAVMAAVSLLSAGAGSAIAQKVMAKVGDVTSKLVDKLMNSIMGQMLQGATSKLGQQALVRQLQTLLRPMMQKVAANVSGPAGKTMLQDAQTALSVTQVGGTAAKGGMDGRAAQHQVGGSEATGRILELEQASKTVQRALKDAVENNSQSVETMRDVMNSMSSQLAHTQGTSVQMARNVANSRAL
ncbi:type III secretion system translocon subunit SctE [Pseudomonas typographi]|uniref:type III secretion system translocon subunit SctE n=1 Tax=Pseudomonas typographi TaxID=2715964 RepID=UPI00168219A7|nr:type III secretion system translocon subunit SctE [Pseudomonas typographi]MBD1587211.1 type III secretion system translocon subunit SctE [Pseudomonas typographi]